MRKNLTRQERLRRYDRFLDVLTVLFALAAVLFLMWALRSCQRLPEVDTESRASVEVVIEEEEIPGDLEQEEIGVAEFPENPREQELIAKALVASGYYSDSIPLSYELQDTLRWACSVNGIPYCVGLGLIDTESRFNTEAVSRVGCYGLCQLNPKYFPEDLDPFENIVTGMQYLGTLIQRYNGDLPAALRAYNRGHDDGCRIYPNTVLANAEKWRDVLDKEGVNT